MTRKLPSTLNTEELLKQLETTDASRQLTTEEIIFENEKDDVLAFISTFNIVPGKEIIKKTTLYNIYKAWSLFPVSKASFAHQFGSYIPAKKDIYYAINQNAVKLTYDAYKKFEETKRSTLKSPAWVKRVEDFLAHYNIKPGKYWIANDILYFLYDKMEYERGKTGPAQKLSRYYFQSILKVFLRNKRTLKSTMYAVDKSIKEHFQPGQLERMKVTYAKQEGSENYPKRKSKKKTKIRRT